MNPTAPCACTIQCDLHERAPELVEAAMALAEAERHLIAMRVKAAPALTLLKIAEDKHAHAVARLTEVLR